MQLGDLGEPTSFLDHVYLGCFSTWCKSNEIISDEKRKMFETRISAGAIIKLLVWEKFRSKTVAWSFETERQSSTILWIGKQEGGVILQNPCLDDQPILKARRTRIKWRIVRNLLTNCLDMFVLITNWKIWHSLVGQQVCKISHYMDSSMWQTIGNIDFIHSPHNWPPTILPCG